VAYRGPEPDTDPQFRSADLRMTVLASADSRATPGPRDHAARAGSTARPASTTWFRHADRLHFRKRVASPCRSASAGRRCQSAGRRYRSAGRRCRSVGHRYRSVKPSWEIAVPAVNPDLPSRGEMRRSTVDRRRFELCSQDCRHERADLGTHRSRSARTRLPNRGRSDRRDRSARAHRRRHCELRDRCEPTCRQVREGSLVASTRKVCRERCRRAHPTRRRRDDGRRTARRPDRCRGSFPPAVRARLVRSAIATSHPSSRVRRSQRGPRRRRPRESRSPRGARFGRQPDWRRATLAVIREGSGPRSPRGPVR
jgi:hypothetical protein